MFYPAFVVSLLVSCVESLLVCRVVCLSVYVLKVRILTAIITKRCIQVGTCPRKNVLGFRGHGVKGSRSDDHVTLVNALDLEPPKYLDENLHNLYLYLYLYLCLQPLTADRLLSSNKIFWIQYKAVILPARVQPFLENIH